MNLFDDPYAKPPDFTNAEGVKWWHDKDSTAYARRKDANDISLPNVTCWFVEEPNGHRTRLILDDQKIEYVTQKMEDQAVHIEMIKTAKNFKLAEASGRLSSTVPNKSNGPK